MTAEQKIALATAGYTKAEIEAMVTEPPKQEEKKPDPKPEEDPKKAEQPDGQKKSAEDIFNAIITA